MRNNHFTVTAVPRKKLRTERIKNRIKRVIAAIRGKDEKKFRRD